MAFIKDLEGWEGVYSMLSSTAIFNLYQNEFGIDINELMDTLRSSDFYDDPDLSWRDVEQDQQRKRTEVSTKEEVIKEVNVVDITAKKMMLIKTPEGLFTKEDIKAQYKALALKWHPDRNGNSKESGNVFAHISKLYAEGLDHIAKGIWHVPGKLHLTSTSGQQFNITYKYRKNFELGSMYVGHGIVAYTIHKDFSKLASVAEKIVDEFKFHNPPMETEFRKYLPTYKKVIETDDYHVFCIEKTKDVIPLSVLLNYFDGFVPPEHVAWIMSSLHNMLCYLNYTKIVHNDINLNTYFVSPEFHSGLLLGGWWYSAIFDGKLRSVPDRTYKYMQDSFIKKKQPDLHVDNELARAVCRSLLGDEIGSKLIMDKRIPKAMLDWLRMTGKRDRVADYKLWKKNVLIKAFGKVEFVPMRIVIDEAYSKMGVLE